MSVLYCFLFFFFFKQKTAYEMRISDWSSDVCSSDLRNIGALIADELVAREADIAFGHLDQRLGERLDEQVVDAELDPLRFERGIEFAAQFQQLVELDIDREIDVRDRLLRFGQAAGAKIGRASCRERVCRYV